MKKKLVLVVILELMALALMFALVWKLQTDYAIKYREDDIKLQCADVQELMKTNEDDVSDAKNSFERIIMSKTKAIALALDKKADEEVTGKVLRQYSDTLNIENVFLVDSEGNILEKSGDTPADFTRHRFDQLRLLYQGETELDVGYVDVVYDQQEYVYIAALTQDGNMVITECKTDAMNQLLEENVSWKKKLNQFTVGMNGYAFSISKRDYTIQSHPDEKMVGKDALLCGINVESLKNEEMQWFEMNGERLYGGVIEADDVYVFCVVTEDEMLSANYGTLGIILFLFLVITIVIIAYAYYFIMEKQKQRSMMIFDEDGEGEIVEEDTTVGRFAGFYYDKLLLRKLSVFSLLGMITMFVMSLFMQHLFVVSNYSVSCKSHIKDVKNTINQYEDQVNTITDYYNENCLEIAQFVAYIVSNAPDVMTRESLAELSKAIDVSYTYIFDKEGKVLVTDSPYDNFVISDDPESQSYEFSTLLSGVDHVVQAPQADDVSGNILQYVGVSLRDENDLANGFVQIGFEPIALQTLVDSMNLSSTLKDISVGSKGFAFAVSKEDNTLTYYPDENVDGKKATSYGIEERQLMDDYSGYIQIGKTEYFGVVGEMSDYYLFVVVPKSELNSSQIMLAFLASVCTMLSLSVIFCVLDLRRRDDGQPVLEDEQLRKTQKIIEIPRPQENLNADSVKGNEKSEIDQEMEERWNMKTISWSEKSAGQKSVTILKTFIFLFALFVGMMYTFGSSILGEQSIFLYIINGNWEKVFSIFSVTACFMEICVIVVCVSVLEKLLFWVARVSNSKGETICHLTGSFIKYVSVIVALYDCFAQFGVDTQTLLASAGILSLVIGLALKDILTDIIAGLFIILEDEFRVGDFIDIGSYMGMVKAIGVRSTKIERNGQTKVVNNSDIKGVLNMSGKVGKASCTIGIGYEEPLERVEEILRKELPLMKDRLPGALKEPKYKGVSELGDNSVNLKISVDCVGPLRRKTMRALNREMKLLFDRYHINIPYPQIVINQPVVYEDIGLDEEESV